MKLMHKQKTQVPVHYAFIMQENQCDREGKNLVILADCHDLHNNYS